MNISKDCLTIVFDFIPINYHPILRLVCKKWSALCHNKKCIINKIIPYATSTLLKWVLDQPNVHKWTHKKEEVVYTCLSLKAALKYDNFEAVYWIKNNSIGWNMSPSCYTSYYGDTF